MKTLIVAKNLQAFRRYCASNIPVKSVSRMEPEYLTLKNGDVFIYVSQIEALRGHDQSAQVIFTEDWFYRPDHMEIEAVVKDCFPRNWKEV